MSEIITHIYDYLKARRGLYLTALLLLTVVLMALLSRQRYKEDITDFLPLGSKYGQALKVYQEISGASRIVAIVAHSDTCTLALPEMLTAAVDAFSAKVQERDTMGISEGMMTQIDMEQVEQTAQFIYTNMPYFLTDSDYARMDSLLTDDDYIPSQLAADKQMLLFPMAGLLAQNVGRDPLNLFTPVVAMLQQRQMTISYENYDGYILTPDMSRAVILMQSPFGSSETSRNARLMQFLEDCAAETEKAFPDIDIHFTGGPVIAVGNADQIKRDSLLAVSLALLLIVGLLFTVFRRVRSLLLIVLSIAWGWLFAMGMLALLHDSVSVIVVGISSVIIGIAVNYPLHLIAHLRHTTGVRQALREIVAPLVVGNITTVGAFLALVPLESVALRDLGLFSSLLLVGTILFVLIFLPQIIGSTSSPSTEGRKEPLRRFHFPLRRRIVFGVIVVLTLILGYFSLDTTFDANIANINYMTPQQRQDMEYFASSLNPQTSSLNAHTIYVVSSDTTSDAALSRSSKLQPLLEQLKSEGKVISISGCQQFLCSRQEQERRLALWREFINRYGKKLEEKTLQSAQAEGFAENTFDNFFTLLHSNFASQPQSFFVPLTTSVFASCLAVTDSTYNVIETLITDSSCTVSDITSEIDNYSVSSNDNSEGYSYAFDVEGMNSSIATHLSDDFNYIGWVCGLIVFLFLWFSLGSLELAILSFLPMAVSWLWILGIMSLLDIHFNVVNIILATFIFGQGDDYTIFMTEGCQYEYAYRRPMLASYKESIILSALIMFIGIGTLIFAQHPALRSLAQVTIIGMFCVVLTAWFLPPFIFRWLVTKNGCYRQRPFSLALLWYRLFAEKPGTQAYLRHLVYDRYRYKGLDITTSVARGLRRLSTSDVSNLDCTAIAVINCGYGEVPLLLALRNPKATIFAIDADADKLVVARHSADQLAPNITFLEKNVPSQTDQLRSAYPDLQIIRL